MSAESPYILFAHLPDTEETEDMIHTVSIEIVLHLLETTLPPTEVILGHLIPVIGREAPVLTADREIIGRSTGRSIQVEEVRINSCIDRVRADTDRYITLHRYADRVRISDCVSELLVRMELEELIEILRLTVTLSQESSVRLEPFFILLLKCFVFRRTEEGLFVLLVEGLEEYHLRVINVLIVSEGEGIEFSLLRLVFLLLRRRQTTHLLNIDIDRMEGEDGNSVVRIAI